MTLPSDFGLVHRLAVHGLVASGFLGLLMADEFSPLAWLLAAFCSTLAFLRRDGRLQVPRVLALPAASLGVGGVAIDLGLLSTGLPTVSYLGRIAFDLQLIALFLPEVEWVYRGHAALAFAHMLAAAGLTTSIGFLFAALAFIVSATWTLVLFQVWEGMKQAPGRSENQWRTLVAGPMVFRLTSIAIVVFALTVMLFFLIPRYGAGYFFSRGEETPVVTGFSENVRLGAIGEVKKSSNVVMRVWLPDWSTPPLWLHYWRGVALDLYDGNSWRRGPSMVRALTQDEQGFQERTWDVSATQDAGRCQVRLRQNVFLNQPNTSIIFAAARVEAVRGKFSRLTIDGSSSIRVEFPAFSSYFYQAVSATQCASEAQLAPLGWKYPSWIRSRYLQVPFGMQQVADLAAKVTAGRSTPYEKVLAIRNYLSTGFSYTLDLSDIDPDHPLEDFLFRRRSGHCEFFATAMALMLRTQGVPTRIVNGYQVGQWNDVGNYFLVRRSDAHSWVEVYFPEYGWFEFDPTPSAPMVEGSHWYSRLDAAWDAVRLFWKRSVIEYHLLDQIEHLRSFVSNLRKVGHHARNGYRSLKHSLTFPRDGDSSGTALLARLSPAAILLLLCVPAAVLARELARRTLARRERENRIRFFERLVQALLQRGYSRPAHQTPMEFARDLATRVPDGLALVPEVTALYYRVRFGAGTLSADEVKRIDVFLDSLGPRPRA